MKSTKSLRAFQRTFEQAFRTSHAPIRRIPEQPRIRAFHIAPIRPPAPSIGPSQRREIHSSDILKVAEQQGPQLTDRTTTSKGDADAIATRKALSPAYQLHFTCKKCLERSSHTISKQAYHFGTCVINCPNCKSQHLISDNLRIFEDKSMTMEDLAKKYGEKLKKGRLGVNGDVEFYDDDATAKIERDTESIRRAAERYNVPLREERRTEESDEVKEQRAMDERIRRSLSPSARDGE